MATTWSLLALALSFAAIPYTKAEGETSIWINQIPLYDELAPCASERISAIIRAQESGCNDDSAHTSFACFCIDSSSEFSSIISTAVAQQCSRQTEAQVATITAIDDAAQITPVPARRGAARRQATVTPAQDVSSALDLFASYCAKSTMLSKCKINTLSRRMREEGLLTIRTVGASTSSQHAPATVTITQAPHTITVTPPPTFASTSKPVPIAAIIAPAIFVALISIVGALLYVRRSRKNVCIHALSDDTVVTNKFREEKDGAYITELSVSEETKNELQGENRASWGREQRVVRAELPCAAVGGGR
jgi:hypothetical protein